MVRCEKGAQILYSVAVHSHLRSHPSADVRHDSVLCQCWRLASSTGVKLLDRSLAPTSVVIQSLGRHGYETPNASLQFRPRFRHQYLSWRSAQAQALKTATPQWSIKCSYERHLVEKPGGLDLIFRSQNLRCRGWAVLIFTMRPHILN